MHKSTRKLRSVAGTIALFVTATFQAPYAAAHENHDHEPAAGRADDVYSAAHAAQAAHRFDEAIELLQAADRRAALDDRARLLLASVYLVLGDADKAGEACRRLSRSTVLVVLTCRARVALVRGEFGPERRHLETLLSATSRDAGANAWLAWSCAVAGDLATADGDSEAAERWYRRSLQLDDNVQVRAALADVLLVLQKWRDVIPVTASSHRSLALDVRRWIAATRIGDAAVDEEIAVAHRQFTAWIDAQRWQHAREMARFYLDVMHRPALAARLAEINFGIQREPEDARLIARTAQNKAAPVDRVPRM